MDHLTKQIVAILRRDGRISFSDVARELGTGRENVASRVNPLIESGQLRIVAGLHPLALGLKVSAHLSIKVGGDLRQIIESLESMEAPVFISVTAGAYQVIVETRQPTMAHLGTHISQIRALPGVIDVQVILYERVLSSFFLGEEPEAISYEFDDTDIDIIGILQENGRIGYAELADRVGMSISGCRTRMLRLTDSRVIQIGAVKQRSDMTDDFMFGIGINARGDVSETSALLSADLGLEFMARTVGRYDLIATVSFSSLREFNQMISRLRLLPSVTYCEQWLHVRIVRERYERPVGHLKVGPRATG